MFSVSLSQLGLDCYRERPRQGEVKLDLDHSGRITGVRLRLVGKTPVGTVQS